MSDARDSNGTTWSALKRRKIVQWALAYAAGAWLVLQVVSLIAGIYGWPLVSVRIVAGIVMLGFPVALVLAWYHGDRGAQRVSGPELLIIAALLVVGATLITRGEHGASVPPAAVTTATAPQPAPVPTPVAAQSKSIAVLPFADLSPGRDQEYFSDGMAEELLNALAKIKDLKVAGRTSSFTFKGRNEDLRAVGQALGVAHVLEGSVRKQGDKVRITAQLVQASDGFHLWSETYDGDMTDVFELQERIARAIVAKLQVILTAGDATRLVPVATNDAEAYALYLQASDIFIRRDSDHYPGAIRLLEQAFALDPNYARAMARIAMLHAQTALNDADLETVRRTAQRAIELDPTLAEPHLALAQAGRRNGGYLESTRAFERARALEPDDATVAFYYAQNLFINGYRRKGIEHLDRLLTIDPMQPNAVYRRGLQYSYDGDQQAAETAIRRSIDLGLSFGLAGLSLVESARGNHPKAREYFLSRTIADDCVQDRAAATRAMAEGMYGGDAAQHARAIAVIDQCLAARPVLTPGWVVVGLLRMGQAERALVAIEQAKFHSTATTFNAVWSDIGDEVRALPRFGEVMRAIGMADVWEQYGPPDRCKRVAALEYRCE